MNEKMTWLPTWRHFFDREFFGGQVSWATSKPWTKIMASGALIGENRQLVTYEPAEFEKQLVEVQHCKKITEHFRGIHRICPNSIKENRLRKS